MLIQISYKLFLSTLKNAQIANWLFTSKKGDLNQGGKKFSKLQNVQHQDLVVSIRTYTELNTKFQMLPGYYTILASDKYIRVSLYRQTM